MEEKIITCILFHIVFIGDTMKKIMFFLCFLLCIVNVHAVDFQGQSYIVMESTQHNVLEGKNRFKIGTIAYVYKINGLHYEAWDWWWNHYDIDENSYVYFTNYVVCEPFTTIIFDDGSFVF